MTKTTRPLIFTLFLSGCMGDLDADDLGSEDLGTLDPPSLAIATPPAQVRFSEPRLPMGIKPVGVPDRPITEPPIEPVHPPVPPMPLNPIVEEPPNETGPVVILPPFDPGLSPPAPVGEAPPVAEPPEVEILISDVWSGDPMPPAATKFPIEETTDLVFYLYFDHFPEGIHVMWLQHIMPGGSVYQNKAIAFAVGATTETWVDVEGLVSPVQVRTPVETPMGVRVDEVLPVAGTPIETYWLTGAWTAVLYVGALGGVPIQVTSFDLY